MRKRAQPTTSRRPGSAASRPGSSASTRSLGSNGSNGSSISGPLKRPTSSSTSLSSSKPILSTTATSSASLLLRPPSPKGLKTDDIDFLPSIDDIEALCDPELYITDVQLSEEVIKKEAEDKNRKELLQRCSADSVTRRDPSEYMMLSLSPSKAQLTNNSYLPDIYAFVSDQLLNAAKSLDEDKWLYESIHELSE